MSSQELLPQQKLGEGSSFISSDAPLPSSPTPAKVQNVSTELKSDNAAEDKVDEAQPANPRLAALDTKRAKLEAKLADLQAQRMNYINKSRLPSGLDMPAEWTEEQKSKQALATANGIIKEHIALLHDYNEIKDIGQGLMGLIADKRGVRQKVVMEDFGMDDKD